MKFNLSEVLEIAVNIEKSGFNFYSTAAKKLPEFSDFFSFLAKEEVKHEVCFGNFKKNYTSDKYEETVWDPDGIISVYLDSLTGSSIFDKNEDMLIQFEGIKTITDVIDWAIQREHDTILFFIGIKSTFDNVDDKKIVDEIISEEINHVHILMNKKSELSL